MEYHGQAWNYVGKHGITQNSMENYGSTLIIMEALSWSSMDCHVGLTWISYPTPICGVRIGEGLNKAGHALPCGPGPFISYDFLRVRFGIFFYSAIGCSKEKPCAPLKSGETYYINQVVVNVLLA